MNIRDQLVAKAQELGFADLGITTAEPFAEQYAILDQRWEAYAWTLDRRMDLKGGLDPRAALPQARSIIVLLHAFFQESYPCQMERHFGRCYLDDDRVTKDGLALKLRAFRDFLASLGIQSKVPPYLPQRLAAARAGLGDFGKNCLLYAHRVARQGSWVTVVALVVDAEFTPDEPTERVGCPDWCHNACLTACPTGALKGPRHLDPRRCISYLTYFGQDLTPRELREPMGLYVYGCDRCQDVCPRNAAWLAADLPPNPRAAAKAPDFALDKLLHMDEAYFQQRIWPHMFYMKADELWRWRMNVARVMGNTRDERHLPDLARAFREQPDPRARAMCAWAMGRIGGPAARAALDSLEASGDPLVAGELEMARAACA